MDPDRLLRPVDTSSSQGSTIYSKRSPFFSRGLRIGSGLGRTSSTTSKTSQNVSETKGSFGLTTLYLPEPGRTADVLVHIVFVHGLGGGSEHTWTKGSTFWPRDFLPREDACRNSAIHSFGYDSNFKSGNVLDISDFARSLLGNMLDSPDILRSMVSQSGVSKFTSCT